MPLFMNTEAVPVMRPILLRTPHRRAMLIPMNGYPIAEPVPEGIAKDPVPAVRSKRTDEEPPGPTMSGGSRDCGG